MTLKNESNRREFFRSSGIVFLKVLRGLEPATWNNEKKEPLKTQKSLDSVAIQLMHFKSKVAYQKPDQQEHLLELANIIEELHQSILAHGASLKKLPQSEKKTVIISGSGLEFVSQDNFEKDEMIFLELTLPEYPYTTLHVEAKVVVNEDCHEDSEDKCYRVCVAYENISEETRESIIKYVNQLEREHHTQKTEKKTRLTSEDL